jgi:hypothetical protein
MTAKKMQSRQCAWLKRVEFGEERVGLNFPAMCPALSSTAAYPSCRPVASPLNPDLVPAGTANTVLRYKIMITVRKVLISGLIAEAALCLGYAVFGHGGPCGVNSVVGVVWMFHTLCFALADTLHLSDGWFALSLFFITGAAQFSLVACLGMGAWRVIHARHSN